MTLDAPQLLIKIFNEYAMLMKIKSQNFKEINGLHKMLTYDFLLVLLKKIQCIKHRTFVQKVGSGINVW